MTTANNAETSAAKIPSWLTISAEGVTVKLSKPATVNGLVVDKVLMRSPTLGEFRAADKLHPNDAEGRELTLFSGLTTAGHADLIGFDLKDYWRLQRGYLHLVEDDEV